MRRFAAAVACALAGMGVLAPSASADEWPGPTTQAVASNADWIPYLDPPEKPAAVCLVDSGVNITPDTPADSPDGPILKRLSLDGGPGTAANSTWEGLHGTRMAFVGAAPVNGWGAVGFWPGARVVSIRAMRNDRAELTFDDYSRALALCTKHRDDNNIAAINLALACSCTPTETELARLEDRVVAAHANGESVVAAAGNSAGPVGNPANAQGVYAVAAANGTASLCPFSNRGTGIDLIAPGCDLELADPVSGSLWSDYQSGTSGASVTTSIALALLRSYRPDLGWEASERLLATSGRVTPDGRVLDIGALFRDAGLSALVSAATARMQREPPPANGRLDDASDAAPASGDANPMPTALGIRPHPAAPRIKWLRRLRSSLIIAVRKRPTGATLLVSLQRRGSEFGYVTVLQAASTRSWLRLRMPRPWPGGRLVLKYRLGRNPQIASRSVYRAVPR